MHPHKIKSLSLFTLKTHQMFSAHTTLEKFEKGTITGHFVLVLEEKPERKTTWLLWCHSFRKAPFSKCFPSTLKRKNGGFRRAFSWRISVDGRPNRKNKAAFSHFSCEVWTGPQLSPRSTLTLLSCSPNLPRALYISKLHAKVWIKDCMACVAGVRRGGGKGERRAREAREDRMQEDPSCAHFDFLSFLRPATQVKDCKVWATISYLLEFDKNFTKESVLWVPLPLHQRNTGAGLL